MSTEPSDSGLRYTGDLLVDLNLALSSWDAGDLWATVSWELATPTWHWPGFNPFNFSDPAVNPDLHS